MENNKISETEKMTLGDVPSETHPAEKKSNLLLFVIIGVVIVLALTAVTIYMLLSYPSSDKIISPVVSEAPETVVSPVKAPDISPVQDSQTNALKNQSNSVDLGDIEKDINNTNLDNLDSDVSEFDALFE